MAERERSTAHRFPHSNARALQVKPAGAPVTTRDDHTASFSLIRVIIIKSYSFFNPLPVGKFKPKMFKKKKPKPAAPQRKPVAPLDDRALLAGRGLFWTVPSMTWCGKMLLAQSLNALPIGAATEVMREALARVVVETGARKAEKRPPLSPAARAFPLGKVRPSARSLANVVPLPVSLSLSLSLSHTRTRTHTLSSHRPPG